MGWRKWIPGNSDGPYYPGKEGGLTGWQGFLASVTGGLSAQAIVSYNNKKKAEKDADRRRKLETQRQATIDSDIGRVRAAYGVGDSAEAVSNKAALDNWLGDYEADTISGNNKQLDEAHVQNEMDSRHQLAHQGLLGGSVDVGAQRKALSDYVAGRQRAVATAKQARQGIEQGLQGQRMAIEGQVAQGVANPDWDGYSAAQHSALDSAKSDIPLEVGGAAFTTAGSAYMQDQDARGRGRRGFTWNSPSTSSSAGSIS